ncbi:MAG: nitroreductase [Nitrososphaeraceae archaeon]|nr:nitroreductase [Nitrososphaeraceae archaeon]
MDTFESIATKLEVREYSPQDIPSDIRLKVLEAARLTGTGLNTQHWRFILVENKDNLKKLAEDSTSGLFTGLKEGKLRNDFVIPKELSPTIIVGFGYPARKLTGKRKNRLPLDELVHYEKYGNSKR